MMRSRVMPPAFAAAKDKTRTPNRSSRRLTPGYSATEREHEGACKIEHERQRTADGGGNVEWQHGRHELTSGAEIATTPALRRRAPRRRSATSDG